MTACRFWFSVLRWRLRLGAGVTDLLGGMSSGETLNHLHDAFTEKYITEDEYAEVRTLAERAVKTATAWHVYLDSCPDKPPADRRLRRQKVKRDVNPKRKTQN